MVLFKKISIYIYIYLYIFIYIYVNIYNVSMPFLFSFIKYNFTMIRIGNFALYLGISPLLEFSR